MRKWTILAAVLAVALVAPASIAQTQEEMMKNMAEINARLNAVEAENAALKSQMSGNDERVLEGQINALAERYAAGTTVKSAANPVTLSGEFRFRSSWSFGDNDFGGNGDGGGGGEDEHDGSWTDSIIRMGFQYDFTRDVTAFAELQARWAFGDGAPTVNGAGTTTPVRLHQGFLEVRNLFNRPEFSSRTGRQEIVLGNQFQFGNADWYNGWSFDATRWDWDSESFSLSGIIARLNTTDGDFNQLSTFQNAHDNDELYSLYFTLKTIKNHQLDLYWIYINGHGNADGAPGASSSSVGIFSGQVGNPGLFGGGTAYYHTIGARIGGIFPDVAAGLDWNVEFAYQFGDQNTNGSGEIDIDAFALEAEFGVTFNKSSLFRIYARMLWASGPSDDDELGYIPLYPNRHSNGGFRARYGIIDLIPMTNVFTLQAGLHFDPDPAWTLGLTVLWATVEDDSSVTLTSGQSPIDSSDDYGWEIDVWGEYRYSEHLVFNAGLAFFFADDASELAYGLDDDMHFLGYVQARLLF